MATEEIKFIDNRKKPSSFDEIFNIIGVSKHQILVYILIGISNIHQGAFAIGSVVLQAKPSYNCISRDHGPLKNIKHSFLFVYTFQQPIVISSSTTLPVETT